MVKCTGLHDDTVTVVIGGEAGQGISRSGVLLGKSLMRAGFHCFGEIDYPSLIRGGHNFYSLRASSRKVHSTSGRIDLLVALNKESVLLHLDKMNSGGGVIHDETVKFENDEIHRNDVTFYPLPMSEVVKELGGPTIMRNTVGLGAVAALVELDIELLKNIVKETFEGRERIIRINQEALQKGFEYVIEFDYGFQCNVETGEKPDRILLTGNEAVALGAIQAGCKFYSAYPMTPASPVLHYLAGHDEEAGMAVIQAESEISAMLMTVGAGYTGVRAMTSTSGGGFCLMTEALSFAGMTETPVVVMIGQRPGPSTGLATYSSQGDLMFSIFGGHGEFQRVVVAPGDANECFYLTTEAFNLAERFQIPVIVLTDKSGIESHESVESFDLTKTCIDRGKLVEKWGKNEQYLRFKFTEDGISPRAPPGTPNTMVLASSNEHLESGRTTSSSDPVNAMVKKRALKEPYIRRAVEQLDSYKIYGDPDPDVTLVCWGSTKGPLLEALSLLQAEGVRTRLVQVIFMEPFPLDLPEHLEGTVILFENNSTSQLASLTRMRTGYIFPHMENRYDGRPFEPEDVRDRVLEVIQC